MVSVAIGAVAAPARGLRRCRRGAGAAALSRRRGAACRPGRSRLRRVALAAAARSPRRRVRRRPRPARALRKRRSRRRPGRPLAGREQALARGGPRSRGPAPAPPKPATHARAAASSRRPTETRRRAMSSGHSSRASTSSSGHRSVKRLVAVRSCVHGSSGGLDDRAAGRPSGATRGTARRRRARRYSAAVGATSPIVRPSGAGPRPRLRHPDRVRAGLDLAERRLVDARRGLDEVDGRRARGSAPRPTPSSSRSPVASRRPRRSRRAATSSPPVVVEAGLDAVGLLARERPAHELREEPVEPAPADPVLGPAAGRVRRPRDGPAEAVLPLGEERVVAGRHEHRLRGRLGRRAVVAEELRAGPGRGRAGSATTRSGSGRTAPRRSAARRPAGSP